MNNLIGLSRFCSTQNILGFVLLEYIPLASIDQSAYEDLILNNSTFLTAVPLLADEAWLSVPLLPKARLWNENPQTNKQGTSYTQRVGGTIKYMEPAASAELERMAEHDFILRVKDKNGQLWLLGSFDFPFKLIAPGTTGSSSVGNGYKLDFQAVTPTRAKAYGPLVF